MAQQLNTSPPEIRIHSRMRVLAGLAIAVITAAAVTGVIVAVRFLHGTGDTLAVMAPSDTALYVNIDLDPSAGQKLAVAGLLDKFPGLSSQLRETTVNRWLDSALSGSGLNHDDVRPWLGSNISVVALESAFSAIGSGGSGRMSPPFAVLIASSDDGKAQAALDKYKNSPAGTRSTWSTTAFDGVPVTAGTGGGGAMVFAVTNRTVVIGSNNTVVDEVIDTAAGKRANLTSVAEYTAVQAQLPSERLASMYLNVGRVVNRLTPSSGSAGTPSLGLNPLRAYTGMGLALVATSSGITLDGTEDFDTSKLTPDTRSLLSLSPHVNGTLTYVPQNAYGLFAFTGFQHTLRGVLNSLGSTLGTGLNATLQQLGLTGSGGITQHLKGDAGVEVDAPARQSGPAGALIFDTDSSSAAQSFLDNLASLLCNSSGACAAGHLVTESYRGVKISSVSLSSGGPAVEPSWAVTDGWAILGSNRAEVRAILDAHGTGRSIAASPTFSKVIAHVSGSNNATFYLDIHAIAAAIRATLPPADQAAYESNVAPYLNPFTAMGMSEENASDHVAISLFVLVE